MFVVIVLGVLIGAIMGLTGAGGGILAVPVLVAGMHWTMQQAAPVALISVASGAAVGAIDGFRHRLVRYKAAIVMALWGVPMTRFGQNLAQILPQYLLLGLFALLMLIVSWRFYQQSKQVPAASDDALRLAFINQDTGKFIWTLPATLILSSIGMLTGLMTGLLGVGGGFLIVPLLRRFTHLAMPGIVATSLFVITLVGGGGVASALLNGVSLPIVETCSFVAVMIIGMLFGRVISRRLQPAHVQRVFSVLLAFVAIYMFIKAWNNY
jgi:uncharacterized protein